MSIKSTPYKIYSNVDMATAMSYMLARFAKEPLPLNIAQRTSLVATHWVAMNLVKGVHVITHNGEPAGYAFTSPPFDQSGKKGCVRLELLYVYKNKRGLGLGSTLAEYIAKKYKHVSVAIEDKNLKKVYKKAGFKKWEKSGDIDIPVNKRTAEVMKNLPADDDCLTGYTTTKASRKKYLDVVRPSANAYADEVLVLYNLIDGLDINKR